MCDLQNLCKENSNLGFSPLAIHPKQFFSLSLSLYFIHFMNFLLYPQGRTLDQSHQVFIYIIQIFFFFREQGIDSIFTLWNIFFHIKKIQKIIKLIFIFQLKNSIILLGHN